MTTIRGKSNGHKKIRECGYTSVLNIIPNCKKYGIDINIFLLSSNNFPLNKKVNWISGKAKYLPFNQNSFDMIFCSNALDHFSSPDMREMLMIFIHFMV